jgi:NADH-quinone oxidoreductase subunit I
MPDQPSQPPAAAPTPDPAAPAVVPAPTATATPRAGLNVTGWSPGEDVIVVQRTPAPGAARGTWRTFRETVRGLMTTFGRFHEPVVTVEYPEEKTPVYPRFRGRHKLHRFEDVPSGEGASGGVGGEHAGLEKCVGCSLCAAACPADCIRVVAAENTPEHRVSAGERYAAVYEINMSRCIFCGYCEVACPFDAITMGHDYELSDYDRTDLIFTKEMLLAEPLERTPLRNEGE